LPLPKASRNKVFKSISEQQKVPSFSWNQSVARLAPKAATIDLQAIKRLG